MDVMNAIDTRELCRRVVKYLLMGVVIATCSLVLPKQKLDLEAVLALSLVAGATFAIIDTFMPTMSYPVQLGAGFGIGAGMVGFGA
jgi:hypothetical protein